MKIILALLVSLALTACVTQTTLPDGTTKAFSITESISLLKAKGCDALPPLERRLLVLAIKSQVPNYPVNGICDPVFVENWIIGYIQNNP